MPPTYADIAGHLRRGEWTSYGDISAAVHGSFRAARAVGRAAATDDDFPNAHRVLRADGSISRGAAGGDVARVRARLEGEGIGFDRQGRADPALRVEWDELARRSGSRDASLCHFPAPSP
jgi:alkylated DNA nucleotide flippase Atl1